jgi:hypothetical protein
MGREELPLVAHPLVGVGDGGEGVAEVEFAAVRVGRRGRCVRYVEVQVAEGLVGAVSDAGLAEVRGDGAGGEPGLLVELRLHRGDGAGPLVAPGTEVVPLLGARAAGPQGLLIELQTLGGEGAEDHGAESSVADRKGLAFPVGGRGGVPEG